MANEVEELIIKLSHEDYEVRIQAAKELRKKGDSRAVNALIACLRVNYSPLQHVALDALVKIGDAAVQPLISSLRTGHSHTYLTIKALWWIGDRRAVEPLIEALCSQYAHEQEEARNALWQMSPEWTKSEKAKRIVPNLITAMFNRTDFLVKSECAKTLGEIGDIEALEHLQMILKSRDTIMPKYNALCSIFLCEVEKSRARIIRANLDYFKPLLELFPHITCSKCHEKAKKETFWAGFLKKFTYVVCQKCESAMFLKKDT